MGGCGVTWSWDGTARLHGAAKLLPERGGGEGSAEDGAAYLGAGARGHRLWREPPLLERTLAACRDRALQLLHLLLLQREAKQPAILADACASRGLRPADEADSGGKPLVSRPDLASTWCEGVEEARRHC